MKHSFSSDISLPQGKAMALDSLSVSGARASARRTGQKDSASGTTSAPRPRRRSCGLKSALRYPLIKCTPLLAGLFFTVSAPAQVLPPDAVVGDKTLGEWTAEWWKWVLPIPTNVNPVFDPDGRWASVWQPDGPVFFVVKGYNLLSVVPARSFNVPEGKYLYLPLTLYQADSLDNPELSVQEVHDLAVQGADLINGLHAEIDGVPVPDLFSYRAKSPAFSIDFAEPDNLVSVSLRRPYVGLLDPMVADGYALMVAPLPPGMHTIVFGGHVGPPVNRGSSSTNIIRVVQVPLTQRVEELIELVLVSSLAQNRQRPLLASLEAAWASFEAQQWRAGVNQLGAFQNKVRAQAQALALVDQLTQAAQTIIDRATTQSERERDP